MATYDYATIRVVPRVEIGAFLDVGVVLFCRTRRFLGLEIVCTREKILAFAPMLEWNQVDEHLQILCAIADGKGPVGSLGKAEAFHWIVAPHSTVIQASPVHSGLTHDPAATLRRLSAQVAATQ
jgi:hypothetical protein